MITRMTPRQTLRTLAAAALIVTVIVALPIWAFVWPSARLAPRDLPIGVAGPPQAADAIAHTLAQRGDAFDVHRYADEAAARDAIEGREVYGAVVASPDGMTLLTASAASPLVAQLLQQVVASSDAGGLAARVRVVDVVPASLNDPRGAALGSAVLPLVIVSELTAMIVMSLSRPGRGQAGMLVGAALLAGLVAVGIAQGWLGIIGGNWLVNTGVLSLTILAIASVVTGLTGLLGAAGLALGAPLMVFIGNPFSGITSAPELLPKPVGVIGQLLPPGAGGNLLRSTAFFDGRGGGGHLTVLVVWAALGLAAVWGAALRHRETAPVVAQELGQVVAR